LNFLRRVIRRFYNTTINCDIFTGNISLTGNTVFENLNLSAVKNNDDVKYSINAGANAFTATAITFAEHHEVEVNMLIGEAVEAGVNSSATITHGEKYYLEVS